MNKPDPTKPAVVQVPVVRWIGICPVYTNSQLERGKNCGDACTCGIVERAR